MKDPVAAYMREHRGAVPKPDDAARYAPGTFGCHEALHMAAFLAGSVDSELCEHPAILARQDWLKLAETARHALHELYTEIGKEHLA